MPIISYDNAVKALSELGYNVDRGKLKNLCLGRSKAIKEKDDRDKVVRVWTMASQPSSVKSLRDGASLLGLVDEPVQSLIDYGAGALGDAASVQRVDGPFSPTTGLQQVSLSAASMRAALR